MAIGDKWLSRLCLAPKQGLIKLPLRLFSYQIFLVAVPLPTLDDLLRNIAGTMIKSGGGTILVNENTKSSRGKRMRAKTANDDNFAFITSGVNNLVYRKFLLEKKHKVTIYNFKRLYPDLFFPGKSQFLPNYNKSLQSIRILDTLNPFSWRKTSKSIINKNFDKIIFRFWHPFLAPVYSYIISSIKKNNL